jgi:choline monooxygenase
MPRLGNTGSNIVRPLHRWTYNTSGGRRAALKSISPEPEPLQDNYLEIRLVFEDTGCDMATAMAMGHRP